MGSVPSGMVFISSFPMATYRSVDIRTEIVDEKANPCQGGASKRKFNSIPDEKLFFTRKSSRNPIIL